MKQSKCIQKREYLIQIQKYIYQMNLQKSEWGKFCNCRNSKCMKLYCECFAARVECGKNCHCVDCHNKNNAQHLKLYKDYNSSERKTFKEQLARQHKGCACRKSGCTKKYCQCYQAGLLCRDICKCVECQNNESLSNKKVISELKRNTSSTSSKGASLYPIILTQDNRHLGQILADQNPLNIRDEWIEEIAEDLYKKANQGSFNKIIDRFLCILSTLQNENCPSEEESKNNLKFQNIQFEHPKEQDAEDQEDSSEMMEQEDAQSPLSYQNLKSEENL